MKTKLRFALALLLASIVAGCVSLPDAKRTYSDKPVTITVIETTDTHGAFFPYDFKTDKPKPTSLSQAFTLIKAEREKSGAKVLLLDGGDKYTMIKPNASAVKETFEPVRDVLIDIASKAGILVAPSVEGIVMQ